MECALDIVKRRCREILHLFFMVGLKDAGSSAL